MVSAQTCALVLPVDSSPQSTSLKGPLLLFLLNLYPSSTEGMVRAAVLKEMNLSEPVSAPFNPLLLLYIFPALVQELERRLGNPGGR